MRVAIIGAGMAGLSCADALTLVGHDVQLFDKGRGPGGRMATRRIETSVGIASFDYGAQYFTARDPAFREQVDRWEAQAIVSEWVTSTGIFWVGTPAMNSIITVMAAPHIMRWGCQIASIQKRPQGWMLASATEEFAAFDAIVLAVPAEQATSFLSLHDFDMARQAMRAPSKPCWTGMFAFAEPVSTTRDIIRDHGILGWAARNSTKPGRGGPDSWVVQAHASWSLQHLEDNAPDVASVLMQALSTSLGIALPQPVAATAHRWRYALSASLGIEALWNPIAKLGVCGDWLIGPKVENAWLSGQALARRIAEA